MKGGDLMLSIPCINRETGKVQDLVIVSQERMGELEDAERQNDRLRSEVKETKDRLNDVCKDLKTLIDSLEQLEIPF